MRHQVLVELKKEITETASGIQLLDTMNKQRQRPQEGRVISVGSKVDQVKAGDYIYFEQYSITLLHNQYKVEGYDPDRVALVKQDKIMLVR